MHKTKKAQAEVFGIAIVVVLVIFIIMFLINMRLKQSPSDVKNEVIYTKLAWNFVNSIIKTNTGCEKMSIHDLLLDCAAGKENSQYVKCAEPGGDADSCRYSRNTIATILNKTLDLRGDKYLFAVKYNEDNLIDEIKSPEYECANADYASVPISTGREIVEISIRICRK